MISISGSLPGLSPSWRKEFENEMEEIMRLSARKFVQVASSRIPSLSNQARGTLLDLADFIGTQLKGGPEPRSTRAPRGQSASTGRAQSYYILDFKTFEWGTTVPYFERHDSEEWQAVQEGVDAFIEEFYYQMEVSNITDEIFISIGVN